MTVELTVKSLIKGMRVHARREATLTAAILIVMLAVSHVTFAADSEFGGTRILKHRVTVLSLSELSADKEKAAIFLKKTDLLVYLPKDGVVMEEGDLASVVDLTKGELSRSDYVRVMEVPRTLSKKEVTPESSDRPELVVLVSYGITGKGNKVFVRLLEVSSGQTVFSTQAEGHDLGTAVRQSLSGVEDWLLTQAWRCRVIGVRGGAVVINRGRLDGLREGAKLVGYGMRGVPKGDKESDEATLLKYGNRVGTFIVTEVRNNFAKARADGGKMTLREGDILELPEVRIPDRDVRTRDNRLWDKIYK